MCVLFLSQKDLRKAKKKKNYWIFKSLNNSVLHNEKCKVQLGKEFPTKQSL